MTRSLNETEGKNYLKKAEGSLRIARIAITEGAYDSSVVSSIHSAINALDALSVTVLGRRASGAHTDALLEVKSIFTAAEYSDLSKTVQIFDEQEKRVRVRVYSYEQRGSSELFKVGRENHGSS